MEGALPVIALAAVVMSAGAVVVAAHFRKERTAELRSWARTHGWTYTDHLSRPLGEAALPRSTVGPHPRAEHVLTGRRGQYPVVAFEQTHTMGRGTGRVRHAYRIVAVRTPGPNAELRILRRRDRGISDDTFDSAFHASGNDPAFTGAVLDGVVTKWLLADPRSRSLPVHFSGDYVLTWAAMRLDPDRALTVADYLIDLVERIPDEAWKRRAPGR
ncbi:hypothetical protein [Nocardiopsis quinghaiensis]|uniref:hypothetical protein n=1 Tax=Nocardiopsis quinghaiensis TaxID=464995 RepID=UPI00123A3F21|nr:hypothetical protein [Nocardiopsis quinghaiensis]